MSLATYNKKRSFKDTPEPKGAVAHSKTKLLFVVQKHHASHLHYDFRLELDGALKSWAVPKGPSLNPKDKRLAMEVEDHPLSYATFEGNIPKGNYGAGEVIVWDIGTYRPAESTGSRKKDEKILLEQLKKGRLSIALGGKKLKGAFSLSRMRGNQWLLIKKSDTYATERDITKEINSVLSNRTLANKISTTEKNKKEKKDPFLYNIKPMLATLTDKPFSDPDWFYEIKWDGYRAIAEIEGKSVRLYSRNNLDFNDRYPEVVTALQKIQHTAIFDGEIVAVDKTGRANFQLMQQAHKNKDVTLIYYVFDLLYLDGRDLRGEPLHERRRILKAIIPKKGPIRFSEAIEQDGEALFREAKKQSLEGIIAKHRHSTYLDGKRTSQWLKIKTEMRQEAIIAGFTEPKGSRKNFGALVLGAHRNGELEYIGHTGGGFNETTLREIFTMLKKITKKSSPFKKIPKTNMPVTWVRPIIICEVKFSEWTESGQMRHPIFIGIREDKKPKDVIRESSKEDKSIQVKEHTFSNQDKVFWSEEGYTKGDVIEYYKKIAPLLLPYLKDRPENLHRHPNGITKPSFYQKDFEVKNPPNFIQTEKIYSESNDADIEYLVCNNKETLLYMANLGCIEINPWNSRIGSLDRPDYMVIDLDPGDNSFEEVIKVAQVVHKVLNDSCEQNYCKTSGKTGIHIFVPLQAKYTYDQIRQFSELLVRIVHKKLPDITSIERSPAKRKHKIYLDYLQNRYGQTLCAPYSLRPALGAPVSTPLQWNEVRKGLDPKKFTIKTIFKRIEKYGDLWEPVRTEGVDLVEAIQCLEKTFGNK